MRVNPAFLRAGVLSLAALVALSGCESGPEIRGDTNPTANFAAYKTFGYFSELATDLRWHLSGADDAGEPFVAGVYPLLLDETCTFVAADFDKTGWEQDAIAFVHACRRLELPVAIERSRSGRGAHTWLFFDDPLPASLARRLASFLLTEAM